MKKELTKTLSLILSVSLTMQTWWVLAGTDTFAADGRGGEIVVQDYGSQSHQVTLKNSGNNTVVFTITGDLNECVITCSDPADPDQSEVTVTNLEALIVDGNTTAEISANLEFNVTLKSQYSGIDIMEGYRLVCQNLLGTGVVEVHGTLTTPDFILSEHTGDEAKAFRISGTIHANEIDISDSSVPFESTASSIFRAADSFKKGAGDLTGTIVAGSAATYIYSPDGSADLKLEGTEYEDTLYGYVEGYVGDILFDNTETTLTGVPSTVYVGEDYDFSGGITVEPDDYPGTPYIEYAPADDTLWAPERPDEEGDYQARAVAPMVTGYRSSESNSMPYSVVYLPITAVKDEDGNYYYLEGLYDGIYVDEQVKVVPADGFQIAFNGGDSFDFSDYIMISKDDILVDGHYLIDDAAFAFKRNSDKAETEFVTVSDIETTPKFEDLVWDEDGEPETFEADLDEEETSVEDGREYVGDVLSFVIYDDTLATLTVTVNGETVIDETDVEDNWQNLQFESDENAPKKIHMVATDKVGHTMDCTITLKKYDQYTPTATVSVEDILVGGEIKPEVTTNSDGAVTFYYAVQGSDEFSTAVPTAAGDYTVKAVIAETDDYESVSCTDDFTISRKTVTASVTCPDTYVGEEYAPTVTTVSTGTQTFYYAVKGTETYTTTKPTAAGEYTVKVEIAQSDTYLETSCETDFTISKNTIAATVTCPDTYVGEEYAPTVTTVSTGTQTFYYAVKGTENFTTTPPTAAGDYTVKAVIGETDTYLEIECTADFTISKLTTTATVTCPDSYVDEEYAPTVTTVSTGTQTFYYAVKGTENFTTTPPTAAGDYTVKAVIGETDTYLEIECTADFTISKLTTTATVTCPDSYVDEEYAPTVTTVSTGTQTFYYAVKGTENFTMTKPTAAGEYTVKAVIGETETYLEIECTADFTISKITTNASVTCPDSYVDEEYAPTVRTVSTGTQTFYYAVQGTEDFSTTKPTAAGEYTVKAVIGETAKYNEIECTADFTISKITTTASVTCPDSYVDDEYAPTVTTVSTGTQTFYYAVQGTEDFSTTKPTAAGEYTVKAVIGETAKYNEIECTADFTISKVTTTATVTCPDSYVDDEYDPTVTTVSTGTQTFYYAVQGTEDFTTTKPTAAGDYTVKAVVGETAKYNEIECTADFTISKITVTATVTCPDTLVGDEYAPTVTTESTGTQTFYYAVKGTEEFTTTKPSDAGDYTVKAVIGENAKYLEIECTADFTIGKITTTATVTCPDSYVDEGYAPTVTTVSTGTRTFYYAVKGTENFTTTKPTAAGEYTVKAVIGETAEYNEIECTADFTISKITTTASVTCPDSYVDEEYAPTVRTVSTGTQTFYYAVQGTEDFSTTKPTAAGEYTVKAVIGETAKYNEIECTADFTISKITTTASVTCPDSYVDEEYAPTVTTVSTGTRTFYYAVKGTEEFTTTKPTAAGEYTVKAVIGETAKYNEIECTADFTISKINTLATVTCPDSYVDDEYAPTVTTVSTGTQTFYYAVKGSEDFSTTKPTAAGDYTVKAVIGETAKYNEIECTADFTISKITTTATVTCPDTLVGEEYAPSVTTESTGTQTYYYAVKGTEEFTTTKPSDAGDYTVKAVIGENAKYLEIECTADFTIGKITTTATVTCPDSYVDEEYAPTVTTVSTGTRTFYYAVKGTENFTMTKPTAAGEYTVKAVIGETETYLEIECTADFTISKITTNASVTCPDSYVDEEYAPTVTTVSTGTRTFYYAVKGTENFTMTKPTAAGEYTVKAVIGETETYLEIECTADFTISKITTNASVTCPDSYVDEEYAPTVRTVSTGTQTFYYAVQGTEDFSTTKPTAAGEYTVKAVIGETAKYNEIECTADFTISKITTTASVTCPDSYVDEEYAPTVTTVSTGTRTFYYAVQGTEEYTTTKPTAAGDYTVKAVIGETAKYNEIECTADFTISKITTTASVTCPDSYVNDEYAPTVTTVSTGTQTFYYAVQGTEDFSTTKPTAAGDYTVKAVIGENAKYLEIECTADFTISRRTVTASVSVPDTYVDDEYTPKVTTESNGVVSFFYKADGDTNYTGDKPTAAGSYTCMAVIAESDAYNRITCYDTFEISKRTPVSSVSVPDTYVGEDYEPSIRTDSNGDMSVFYKGEGDAEYSEEKPEAAGTYVCMVVTEETDKYLESVFRDTFTISKRTPSASVSVPDSLTGVSYEPKLETDSDAEEGIVYEYRLSGDVEGQYSTTKPKERGTYTIRVTIPETYKYLGTTCTAEFTISGRQVTSEVSVPVTYIGSALRPSVTTESDGKSKTKYEYRLASEGEDTFTTTKPTEIGSYVVRATVPQTFLYDETSCETEFKIAYLTAPDNAYNLTGTEGDNGFFTSDVDLKAPDGYRISTSFRGEYVESIPYSEILNVIYLKRTADGALTGSITITKRPLIDKVAPAVTSQNGALVDKSVLFVKDLTITVTDDNLMSLSINGKDVDLASQGNVITLSPGWGRKVFKILAVDKAGHICAIEIMLMAEWLKDRVIPADILLPLMAGEEYTLGDGKWTVSNYLGEDNTVYNGGLQVFVNQSGDFTFTIKTQ